MVVVTTAALPGGAVVATVEVVVTAATSSVAAATATVGRSESSGPQATNRMPSSAATSMTMNVVPRWIRSSRTSGTERTYAPGGPNVRA